MRHRSAAKASPFPVVKPKLPTDEAKRLSNLAAVAVLFGSFALALLAVYPAQLESERDSNRARARRLQPG